MPEPFLLPLAGVVLLVAVFWPWGGLYDRWRRRRIRARDIRQQDVLKRVRLDELEGRSTTAQTLGEQLHLAADGAASTLYALEAAGLLALMEGEVRLTPQGRAAAARIIRAHRLWERHLADDTGYSESEWHALAERQEHQLTAAEADALAQQLGQPARDPHGDPIPTADGEVILHEGRPLSELTAGTMARITHIEDEPAEVYDRILAAGLAPGAIVRLRELESDTIVLAANGDEYRLPRAAATAIAALPLPAETPIEHGRPLYSLRPGERGQVVALAPRCRGVERRRMLDLGILPGTTIEAVMTSPSGDPTAYRIRDALIALRREQAGLVRIASSDGGAS